MNPFAYFYNILILTAWIVCPKIPSPISQCMRHDSAMKFMRFETLNTLSRENMDVFGTKEQVVSCVMEQVKVYSIYFTSQF